MRLHILCHLLLSVLLLADLAIPQTDTGNLGIIAVEKFVDNTNKVPINIVIQLPKSFITAPIQQIALYLFLESTTAPQIKTGYVT